MSDYVERFAVAMKVAVPCPTCGRAPEASASYGIVISCGNCYDADCSGDPAEFHSSSPIGAGMSLSEAIEDWNQSVENRE